MLVRTQVWTHTNVAIIVEYISFAVVWQERFLCLEWSISAFSLPNVDSQSHDWHTVLTKCLSLWSWDACWIKRSSIEPEIVSKLISRPWSNAYGWLNVRLASLPSVHAPWWSCNQRPTNRGWYMLARSPLSRWATLQNVLYLFNVAIGLSVWSRIGKILT